MLKPRLHFACGVDELAPIVVEAAAGSGTGAGIGAGPAAAIAAGAGAAGAGIAGATGAFGGATSTAPISATGGAAGATGGTQTASAGTGGTAAPPSSSFFGNIVKSIGPALAGSVASPLIASALGGRRGVTVPPPPGAAMIDPEGAQAAAMIRQRQAISGGLASTNNPGNPGANSGAAFGTATSGSKGLLGS